MVVDVPVPANAWIGEKLPVPRGANLAFIAAVKVVADPNIYQSFFLLSTTGNSSAASFFKLFRLVALPKFTKNWNSCPVLGKYQPLVPFTFDKSTKSLEELAAKNAG